MRVKVSWWAFQWLPYTESHPPEHKQAPTGISTYPIPDNHLHWSYQRIEILEPNPQRFHPVLTYCRLWCRSGIVVLTQDWLDLLDWGLLKATATNRQNHHIQEASKSENELDWTNIYALQDLCIINPGSSASRKQLFSKSQASVGIVKMAQTPKPCINQ